MVNIVLFLSKFSNAFSISITISSAVVDVNGSFSDQMNCLSEVCFSYYIDYRSGRSHRYDDGKRRDRYSQRNDRRDDRHHRKDSGSIVF